MIKNLILSIVVILNMGISNNIFSATYSLIKSESFLKTRATYLVLFSLNAEFNAFDGTIIWDDSNLEESSFSGYAKIEDLSTGYSQIDAQLHSNLFFDKDRYPTMKIESHAITFVEDNKYTVNADLTVKDITLPISETLWVLPHPEDPEKRLFKASFYVNRQSFNLGENLSNMMINDKVLVSFLFAAKKIVSSK